MSRTWLKLNWSRCLAALAAAVLAVTGCGPLPGTTSDVPPELVNLGPKSPALLQPGPAELGFRERGYILHEGDTYHMWYTCYAVQNGPGMLGYATSYDGLTWRKDPRNPIYTERWLEDAMVWHDERDGAYYMVAEGVEDQAQLLTSTDRVSWTFVRRLDVRYTDGSRLSPGPLGTPVVVPRGGRYYLLYERLDDGIWLAVSDDLRVFTNVQDTPVIPLGPDPYDAVRVSLNQILPYHGRYYAIYNAQGHLPTWTTAIAVSDDLIRWDKYAGNPIVDEVIGQWVPTDAATVAATRFQTGAAIPLAPGLQPAAAPPGGTPGTPAGRPTGHFRLYTHTPAAFFARPLNGDALP